MSGSRPLALLIAVGLLLAVCAGACSRTPSAERKPIGAACTSDAACGNGRAFSCAMDHPGGYCEAGCNTDGDCPAEAVCVGGTSISKGDCHKRCAAARAAQDCRTGEGYQCIAGGNDATQDYCDPPGRSELARRLRGKAWRW
jgi:hypothetical protein